MKCPNCSTEIKAMQIFLALNPAAIRCKNCAVKLVGSTLIKWQLIGVVVISSIAGLTISFSGLSIQNQIIVAFVVFCLIAIPNLLIAMKYGAYKIKENA
jgi:hypothetical protein